MVSPGVMFGQFNLEHYRQLVSPWATPGQFNLDYDRQMVSCCVTSIVTFNLEK